VLESFRAGFLGTGTFTGAQLAASAVGMALLLAAGLMLFTHVERTFTDTV
jgi:lipopolysaccharide transport system permease protein